MPARSRKPGGQDTSVEQLWQHQLQESMDAIRTVILHQARSEALHVLMVTSASSGEGKTTLATQLAASLSRAWKRTLVIDGDLRHPATHTLFDVPQEPGLAEVLRGEVEPADAIKATPFSRLWVLPAGNGDAHAIQALAQDNVRTLFEQLKQQYDFIIIDAPPVLPVTDSLLLGQHVDGVLFAILRDVSRAPAIHAAQQKLAPLGVPTLGAVVLGTEAEFSEKNYGFALSAAKG
jgi:capsular exopolysaccharide synthesis family protein